MDRETRPPVLGRSTTRLAAAALAAATCVLCALGALGTLAAQSEQAPPARSAPAPRGLDVKQVRVFLLGNTIFAEVSLGGFFSPRVEESLERGMPATLLVTADLWRDRTGWFDRLESTRSLVCRVRYDAWRGDYDLRCGAGPSQHADSLGAVAAALSRPLRLAVGEARALPTGRRYYVVVTASLRPLTPEGVREVEQFLSSQLRGSAGPGGAPGGVSIARLPSSLLSALAALSGLGDEIAVHRTPVFVIPQRGATTTVGQ